MSEVRKNCKTCGVVFVVPTPMVRKIEEAGFKMPERCKCCNEKKKQVKVLTCKECKGTFNFNKLEEEALKKKYGSKYKEPNFCPKCRNDWRMKHEG